MTSIVVHTARPVYPAEYAAPEEWREQLARNILDQLLIASQATFDNYASDVIHDYRWLVDHVEVPTEGVWNAWWGHDRWGTCIASDGERDLVTEYRRVGLYRIHVPPATNHGRVDAYVTTEEIPA